MGRIKGLEKIKSKEEYQKVRATLESQVKEYIWLSSKKEPEKLIEEELRKTMQQLKQDMGEEEKSVLYKIHRLEIMYKSLKAGTYLTDLRQNITANLILVEQFDAMKEKRNTWETVKGVLTGDKDTKDYLDRKNMISEVNRSGNVNPPNMEMEDPRKIIKDIITRCNLVGITINEEELGLVPIENDNNRGIETREKIAAWTNDFIAERENKVVASKGENIQSNSKPKTNNEVAKDKVEKGRGWERE